MAINRKPLFGYAGEQNPQKGRPVINRDKGGHERWADAILPADAEAGTIETPTSRRPLWTLVALACVMGVLLGVQLFNLQIVNGQRNLGLADGNRLREKITRAPRGIIYDRHNQPLVENIASFDVTVTPSLLPKKLEDRKAIYSHVSELLNVPANEVEAKSEGDCISGEVAAKSSRERAQAECLTSAQPQLVAHNVPRDTALNFEQSTNKVTGFSLDTNPIRQYGDDSLSAILGYTARVSDRDLADPTYTPNDFIGKLGIEKQYESVLRGESERKQTEFDASGRPIKLLASKPGKDGSNVVLTIDTELQKTMSAAIAKQMQASGATQAAGIAMNPKTGEILAAVNLPTYDNNLFAKGISQKDYSQLIKNPAQPLFDKVMAGAYPTGSIIKPLISSAALQEHAISVNTTVDDKGSIVVHNKYDPNITYTYRSYDPGGLGVVNVVKAIAVSSDVFFYTVGGGFGNIAGLGVDKLTSYYQKFGLGSEPGLDLPEQTAGRVPTPQWKQKVTGQPWTTGDTYNISIGQGDLLASPLQMAIAESAIANGGKIMKPHLVKQVKDASGRTVSTTGPEVVRENFISPSTLNTVRQGMRDVVIQPYGTACCKFQPDVPVPVAAKTGTAESHTGGGDKKPHAWFTAFAPYDDPQIEIVVLIQNAGEGAQFAAPAVRETLSWCFKRPGGCVQ